MDCFFVFFFREVKNPDSPANRTKKKGSDVLFLFPSWKLKLDFLKVAINYYLLNQDLSSLIELLHNLVENKLSSTLTSNSSLHPSLSYSPSLSL